MSSFIAYQLDAFLEYVHLAVFGGTTCAPLLADINGGEVPAIGKHGRKTFYVLRVETAQVDGLHSITTKEHCIHLFDFPGIKAREVEFLQIIAILKHLPHVRHFARVKVT